MTKQCSKCKQVKSLTEFNKRSDYKHRYKSACKVCSKEDPKVKAKRNQEWVKKNSERHKDRTLKRKFGISLETYNEMLTKQENCCALCLTNRSDLRRDLNVDHDHSTGRVRGLLCDSCNTALGLFKDSTALLDKAIKYISEV